MYITRRTDYASSIVYPVLQYGNRYMKYLLYSSYPTQLCPAALLEGGILEDQSQLRLNKQSPVPAWEMWCHGLCLVMNYT